MMGSGGWPGSGPWFGVTSMWLIPFVVLGVIVWLIFRSRDRSVSERFAQPPPDTARNILDRRYAAGEISREDYQRMKQDVE